MPLIERSHESRNTHTLRHTLDSSLSCGLLRCTIPDWLTLNRVLHAFRIIHQNTTTIWTIFFRSMPFEPRTSVALTYSWVLSMNHAPLSCVTNPFPYNLWLISLYIGAMSHTLFLQIGVIYLQIDATHDTIATLSRSIIQNVHAFSFQ
jgi:hypothetical protein